MTLQEVQLLLQSLSSIALAGGLVFTAVQFRNARKAQHLANFSKMVELQMHLREMRVKDPGLARVYRHDVENLGSDREIAEYFFNLMQLSVYEIVWYSHRMGQLPEDYYASWERRIEEIAQEPSFRAMVNNPAMKIMHDDFQQFVRELVKRTAPRAGGSA
jgi:hypothetical protein